MPVVLITGFGPYPGAPSNPTGALAAALARRRRPALGGVRLEPHVFATSYAAVDADWPMLMVRHRPDAVLMFGLAPRARRIRIETRARNALTFFPDVSGATPDRHVIGRGESDRVTRAPVTRFLAAARSLRPGAVLSRDAGRYVCNYLYWHALAEGDSQPRLAQFVHVPGGARPADLLGSAQSILLTLVAALRHSDRHHADRNPARLA